MSGFSMLSARGVTLGAVGQQLAVIALIALVPTGCFKRMPASYEPATTIEPVDYGYNLVDTESRRRDGASIADPARSVIRTGSLGLKAKDLVFVKKEVETVVADTRGRIDSWSTTDDRFLHMQLRIPEPRLDEAMDRIASLGKVTDRSLRSSDVTDQVIDLEARLANLIALRDRLRSYLDKAVDLKEILEVEKELTRVQTEVEILQRKLDVLKAQIELSQLSLTVRRR